MRISVQLRTDEPSGIVERWVRSVYVDVFPHERTVLFSDLMPAGETRTRLPVLANVHGVLFAIDATNTKPGSTGWFEVQEPALGSKH
jgi:hypothetical protein